MQCMEVVSIAMKTEHAYELEAFSNNILDTSRDPSELLKGLDWLA